MTHVRNQSDHTRTYEVFNIRNVKDRACNSIQAAEDTLETMKTPAQTPLHVSYIKEMSRLQYKVNNDLMDIDQTCNDHINDTDLKNYGASIIDIGRRASAIYKNMCTKEESINSYHLGMLYARQAAHEGNNHRRQIAIMITQNDHANIVERESNEGSPPLPPTSQLVQGPGLYGNRHNSRQQHEDHTQIYMHKIIFF